MFELKKLNVHKIVATEEEKEKLLSKGFIELVLKEKIDATEVPIKTDANVEGIIKEKVVGKVTPGVDEKGKE